MMYDVAVIGAGPAGLQAAMHSSRRKAETMIIGKVRDSALYHAHVENHFGAIGKVHGKDMLDDGLAKAVRFGCAHIDENVTMVEPIDGGFRVTTESRTIESKALVLAPGTRRNKLNVPGERELIGRGVSYCASCDCNFYKGKTVAIIGNGSEAGISAELMTHYASKTYWIHGDLDVSGEIVNKAREAGVDMMGAEVKRINGAAKVDSLELHDGTSVKTDGVFIELGGRSSADLAMDVGIMPDTEGLIKVDAECRTSVKGVYACGDVTGKPWQASKAIGEGCIAGTNAAIYAKGE